MLFSFHIDSENTIVLLEIHTHKHTQTHTDRFRVYEIDRPSVSTRLDLGVLRKLEREKKRKFAF